MSDSILQIGMGNGVFNVLLLIIVIVIIIVFIVKNVMGYISEKKAKDNLRFPPFPSKCPDYWSSLGDSRCKNDNNIGLCKKYNGMRESNVMDFSDDIFKGDKGMFMKCSWSRKCKAPWEGIDKLCI
jgi:hypothetical protein